MIFASGHGGIGHCGRIGVWQLGASWPRSKRLTQDQLLEFDTFGNVSLIHVTDIHAQLKPIYFREPSINIGVGGNKGRCAPCHRRRFPQASTASPTAALAITRCLGRFRRAGAGLWPRGRARPRRDRDQSHSRRPPRCDACWMAGTPGTGPTPAEDPRAGHGQRDERAEA